MKKLLFTLALCLSGIFPAHAAELFSNSPAVLNQVACLTHVNAKFEKFRKGEDQNSLAERMFFYKSIATFEKGLNDTSCLRFTYKSADDVVVEGFITMPKSTSQPKIPAIIFNRGGNVVSWHTIQVDTLVVHQALARQGFIVIASQYRGAEVWDSPTPLNTGKDEYGGRDVMDVLALWPILAGVPNADMARVGMVGVSRGGMMSFLAAQSLQSVKAIVIDSGLSDIVALAKARPAFHEAIGEKMIPGYALAPEKAQKDRSVHYWPEKLNPNVAILLLHSEGDNRTSVKEARSLDQILTKRNHPHRLVVYPGNDHGLVVPETQAMNETVDWFKRYLVK